MKDLSHIFYPGRGKFDGLIHKFVPDRTIDRERLTVIFFQTPENDCWAACAGRWELPRDKKVDESLYQLREVTDLLGINVIDIPLQSNDSLSEIIKNKGLHSGQVLFLAITQPEIKLFREIGTLLGLGFQIILGGCGSEVSAGWNEYCERASRSGWFREHDLKRIELVQTLEFVDVLLWEEFRREFRSAHLSYLALPFVNDIIIPCLRQLNIGEPKLRLHFREGIKGKYVREFALEIDWELNDESKVRLVFREPIIENPKPLRERLFERFQKSEPVFRFAQTERDYFCLSITDDFEIGCSVTTVSKNSNITDLEITNEYKRIAKKSKEAAKEFLKQNTEAAVLIGVIPKHFHEIKPYRMLVIQEWDDQHFREAIKTSIDMIGVNEQRLKPLVSVYTDKLSERLYRRETSNGTSQEDDGTEKM